MSAEAKMEIDVNRNESESPGIEAADGWWVRFGGISATIYWGIHAACLVALYTGVSVADVTLFAVTFWVRLFGITGGSGPDKIALLVAVVPELTARGLSVSVTDDWSDRI